MEYYIELENQVIIDRANNQETSFCNDIKSLSNSRTQLLQIYNDFLNLVKNAKKEFRCQPNSEQSKCHKFLNYWLNHNLSVISDYTTIKEDFFQCIKTNKNTFDPNDELKDKIKGIDIKYINNMKKIYDLYKHYLDLKTRRKEYKETNIFIIEFKEKYNDVLEKCFSGGEFKFCEALKDFKKFYEKDISSSKPYTNMYPALPKIEISEIGSDELSQIAKIGIRLINGIYTSSLNGLSIIKKGQHSNLTDLINLQYNLRMEKNDEEKYCVMMKILHEFFQYCNENIRNSRLLSFIEEFIDEYYKKEKDEYRKIFRNCANENSKSYCMLYANCNREFKKEITLINKGPEYYIKHKKEYFKELDSDDSLIAKARAIFRDSAAMAKNSPTVMSTSVSFILLVFFLYKLTPLSSIFRKEKKKKKIPFFYPERRIQDVNYGNTRNMNAKHKREKIRFAYQSS